jgi:hypothetical protein
MPTMWGYRGNLLYSVLRFRKTRGRPEETVRLLQRQRKTDVPGVRRSRPNLVKRRLRRADGTAGFPGALCMAWGGRRPGRARGPVEAARGGLQDRLVLFESLGRSARL